MEAVLAVGVSSLFVGLLDEEEDEEEEEEEEAVADEDVAAEPLKFAPDLLGEMLLGPFVRLAFSEEEAAAVDEDDSASCSVFMFTIRPFEEEAAAVVLLVLFPLLFGEITSDLMLFVGSVFTSNA